MGDLPGCMLQRSALLCGWGCAVYPGLLLEQVVPPLGCTWAGAGSVSSKVPERKKKFWKVHYTLNDCSLNTAVAGRQKQIQLNLLQREGFKITSGETKREVSVDLPVRYQMSKSYLRRAGTTELLFWIRPLVQFGYLSFPEYETVSNRE